MFPPGLQGLALLLLRASVAVALLAQYYCHQGDLSGWILAAAILISIALCLGYLTPISAVMCLVLHCVIWFSLGTGSVAVAAMIALDAMALALLGPGSYSVDYYRFGRRLVVLPPP